MRFGRTGGERETRAPSGAGKRDGTDGHRRGFPKNDIQYSSICAKRGSVART